jgi:hypothetical protein
MKNIHIAILSLMMVGATGHAIEESQRFIDVYAIQTKNHKHREMLDVMHEGSQRATRAFMNNSDLLIAGMIQMGFHDAVRDMRAIDRENCSRLQAALREQVQQQLIRWGYLV